MEQIETIKTELKQQRDIIIEKGGTITVSNDYPSPFEVTAGIQSIKTPDFTVTTATEEDVALGKTFYSTTSELKTGTGLFQADLINQLFMPNPKEQTTEETVYYSCPSGLRSIRKYCFYYNYNPIHFVFNPELENIYEYAFYGTKNMTFEGFEQLSKLKSIEQYAFSNASLSGIEFGILPNSITSIGTYCFYRSTNLNITNFRFSDNIASIGASAFRQYSRVVAGGLDLSNYPLKTLSNSLFYYIAFHSDCVVPEGVQTILAYFNYNGTFKDLELPSTLTRLEDRSFGSDSTRSLSEFILQSVTFNSETPPLIGIKVFAEQNITNGFKIYVPDTAIEEYKAIENLSTYLDCIYPMSQKE